MPGVKPCILIAHGVDFHAEDAISVRYDSGLAVDRSAILEQVRGVAALVG
jgi:hypothetical protein